MGQAHTPSPWQASPSWNLNTGKIRVFDQTTMEAVADVWGGNDEAMANARLIAAAPDLLASLKQLISDHGNDIPIGRAMDDASALIAKVEGK
ncbi:MAG: hypothetical protein EOO12_00325 [Chitinophagaceae bacterium]|nr:MAG: hypothetical protein EOO12_00325 [Chitinophagaceae bacterium]